MYEAARPGHQRLDESHERVDPAMSGRSQDDVLASTQRAQIDQSQRGKILQARFEVTRAQRIATPSRSQGHDLHAPGDLQSLAAQDAHDREIGAKSVHTRRDIS